ncbi:MAG: formylmethanofuran dehydrogenase subunit C, partial [Alphaproteobacteria bacterium]|nr:formylmethanofuran dehydrogenase subunit C [Alphaproteobacteria bacterium]
MSLKLTLKKKPTVPVEAESICPDKMEGLGLKDIAALPVHHGNETTTVGDFFKVTGKSNGEIRLEGDTSRFKMVGAAMSKGRILIKGSIGQHVGVA